MRTEPQVSTRRLIATLAAAAVIASVLVAAAASPAAAIDASSEPDLPPEFTACLGVATEGRGFLDVPDDHLFRDDIHCLAYYGVTVGTGDGTTYSPARHVTRWQMALFLDRAMRVANIEVPIPQTDDAGLPITYDDTRNRSAVVRNAITNVVRAGVMEGRTEPRIEGSRFAPDDRVMRVEMAMHLANLAALASPDVVKRGNEFLLGPRLTRPDDAFLDVVNTFTTAENNAVSAAYELGITRGVRGGTRFDGDGFVNRGQMAAFIMRTLAHTNLRPEGVTLQASGTDLRVSVRNADFDPVRGVFVDVFGINDPDESLAFRDDGRCSARVRGIPASGSRRCRIDSSDPFTGADGNVWLAELSAEVISDDGLTAFAWTGSTGSSVRSDTQLSSVYVTKADQSTSHAEKAVAGISRTEGVDLVAFGVDVAVTLQLRGFTSDGTEVDVGAGRQAIEYQIERRYYTGKTASGRAYATETETLRVPRDGRLVFDFTVEDPLPARSANNVTVRLRISRQADTSSESQFLVPAPNSTEYLTSNNDPRYVTSWYASVTFSDDRPVPTELLVEVPGFQLAPALNTYATNTAYATVIDQYGDPLPGATVRLTSRADSNLRVNGVTNDAGVATLSYLYRGGAAHESLTVWSDGPSTTTKNDDLFVSATAYWVAEARSSSGVNDHIFELFQNDQAIIFGNMSSSAPLAAFYDRNDQFFVNGSPVTVDKFTEMLRDGVDLRRACQLEANALSLENHLNQGQTGYPKDVPAPPLLSFDWSSYDYRDVDKVAVMRVLIRGGEDCTPLPKSSDS